MPFSEPQPLRLTVEHFSVLHRSGAFEPYEKTELIEGELVHMNAESRRNTYARNRLTVRLLAALEALGSRYTALSEPSVSIPPNNVPRPDVGITDAPPGEGYFPLQSMALIVEVSHTTLQYDLKRKMRVYALSAVPEYWVLDIENEVLHRFWQPEGAGYGKRDRASLEGELRMITMPEIAIDGRGIL